LAAFADVAGMAKILIVDDDPECRSALRKALLRWQHEVVEARDGNEAIDLYDSFRPALVLLDVVMPKRDGFEVLRSIKAHPHGARIVAMSGGGQLGVNNYLEVMRQLGATAVLPKPFGTDELGKVITTSLQRGHDISSLAETERQPDEDLPLAVVDGQIVEVITSGPEISEIRFVGGEVAMVQTALVVRCPVRGESAFEEQSDSIP
jgi:DNA-binding response OmpR family regulator